MKPTIWRRTKLRRGHAVEYVSTLRRYKGYVTVTKQMFVDKELKREDVVDIPNEVILALKLKINTV